MLQEETDRIIKGWSIFHEEDEDNADDEAKLVEKVEHIHIQDE